MRFLSGDKKKSLAEALAWLGCSLDRAEEAPANRDSVHTGVCKVIPGRLKLVGRKKIGKVGLFFPGTGPGLRSRSPDALHEIPAEIERRFFTLPYEIVRNDGSLLGKKAKKFFVDVVLPGFGSFFLL